MVCIAAFIILCVIGLIVAFLSIFKRDLGRRYWRVFSKAWGCVGKKVRLQKCETNFKEDVKNSMLKRVVLRQPKLVKPLSVIIEIFAILIVIIAIWSLVEVAKSGLSLWVFGSCNVSQPSACTLSSETCSVDEQKPTNLFEGIGRWFQDWGEIFQAIPDRMHNWEASDYKIEPVILAQTPSASLDTAAANSSTPDPNLPYALDVFDPGCIACMHTYRNQLRSGFFTTHNTILIAYPIQGSDGAYKFANSDIIARYFYASALVGTDAAPQIIRRLFTESDAEGISYQALFNNNFDATTAENTLKQWLQDFGVPHSKITAIANLTHSSRVNQIINQVRDLITNQLRAKGIPLTIYDGRLHVGLYEAPHE